MYNSVLAFCLSVSYILLFTKNRIKSIPITLIRVFVCGLGLPFSGFRSALNENGDGRGRPGTAGGGNGHCSQQSQPREVRLLSEGRDQLAESEQL